MKDTTKQVGKQKQKKEHPRTNAVQLRLAQWKID